MIGMGWAAMQQRRHAVEAVCQTKKMATKMDGSAAPVGDI